VLVQAGALAGLPGIARESEVAETFRYYHVELDEHALLLAEGLPAESFLPGAEEAAFDNRAERPARELGGEMPYPRVKCARQVPRALRAKLAGRTAAWRPGVPACQAVAHGCEEAKLPRYGAGNATRKRMA
jgi:hypothetical protein